MGAMVPQGRVEESEILVVDDNGPCREMAARVLRLVGYQVFEAADPAQAEAMLRQRDRLAAAVVDVYLAPDDDLGFARRLRSERPSLPVLFVSGYGEEICLDANLMGPGCEFLQKPFSLFQLERAVGGLLSDAPASRRRTGGSGSKLVLVIEDDPDSRVELGLLLEEQGHEVLSAADGRTGLRLAERHGPDLIVQDLLLPDTHGFDLVARLRALPAIRTRPIIALSAFPDRLDEASAAALGFTCFVRKPPAVTELCDLVQTLLDRQ
jgi:CheY-like chemotaxis protein